MALGQIELETQRLANGDRTRVEHLGLNLLSGDFAKEQRFRAKRFGQRHRHVDLGALAALRQGMADRHQIVSAEAERDLAPGLQPLEG